MTGLDSQGNIHLVCYVQQYQQQNSTHRFLYSKFDPRGNPIVERFLPMGDDVRTYYGRVFLNENDDVYFICKGRDENNEYQYWYSCIDTNCEIFLNYY